ncbi:MAG: NACHT domain-containing protein [Gammaproteobacteria bacterium]|nr:NACHT domain-containing protein [Gammaproteobacteria bacterium]MBU1723342.1 NACHT domain-containing protein [Gammaproteobacteria bacterium]MBU2006637.1 NACHT domain-containing protein [Gammaproteobacteria bacterium]
MADNKLTASQTRRLLPRLESELGNADRQRLAQLLDTLEGDTLNYASVLTTLFPDQDQQKAQNSLRSFRNRINAAAEEAGVQFSFEVDSQKRSAAEERECWFAGEDSKVTNIERYSAEEASDGDSANIVPARGKPLDGKRTIKLFVSYARKDNKDKPQVDKFLEELKQHFSASKKYRYELWADWEVLLGEDWDAEIQGALAACDFGLMLVSLPFINSDYISEHELPKLLERALPVGFQHFEWKHYDMKGLGEKQIFRHKHACYDRCKGDKRKDFIAELFLRIEKLIDKVPPRNPPQPPFCKGGSEEVECVDYVERISQRMWVEAEKGFDRNHTHSKARATSIQNVQSLIDKGEEHQGDEGIIATEYLLEWLRGKDSPAFCALLGEYGMGKTTTCKALTRELLERRKTDKTLPLPIYVDLREYTWDKRVDFTLVDILDHILKKSWKGGQLDVGVKPEDIIQQVQTNRALMIWDGLDEVINHMSSKLANDFIRQLWRVLPPLKQDKTQHPDAGKMLISCRSHYFRNVQEQNAMLTSEHRDGIKGQDYQALILLPFGEEQIETYLSKSLRLDKDKLQDVLELIRSVHNLPEMAERPYTLSLIAQHIPQIEQLSLRGETIQGVTLYQSMVDSWLSRDTGKHQFSPQHKKQLMEYLAAALWKSGQRQWNVDDLDEWLDDFLYENPKLASAYLNLDRNVLKEDLRTATFIVRPDDEHFRFAHTSLQEFFLASYLHRALQNGERAGWRLEVMPSLETLDFLAQLFIGDRSKRIRCEQHLSAWLAENDPQSSKLVFHLWLLLAKRGEVVPYQRMALAGEDLFQWEIKGTKDQPLPLHDVDWQGARLEQVAFDYVEFCHCNFQQARLWQAEFQHCRFSGCVMENADLTASVWRLNHLNALDVSTCQLAHSQWVRNQGQAWGAQLAHNQRTDQRIPAKVWAQLNAGHGGQVNCVAFSPDGGKLASGSSDRTVKLWDVASGECLKTFDQHQGEVLSVTFSPDGSKLASGSGDQTVKLWDVASGECLKTFDRHTGGVNSVDFSPDGGKLASGAADQTIRLWDAANGTHVRTFAGHGGTVKSVRFSPDGKKLASASNDRSIKLWDTETGACLRVLVGHADAVTSVVFSPDGRHLASGSNDRTVRLWSVSLGEYLKTFIGHKNGVLSIAFSPDGYYLVSSSRGGAIKLWSVRSGRLSVKDFNNNYNESKSVIFSPDGRMLASAFDDGSIKIWDLERTTCLNVLMGYRGAVTSVIFSPNGHDMVSNSLDNTVKLWDVVSGECLKTFGLHQGEILSVVFIPDSGKLVSSSLDNTVKLWDVATGKCLKIFDQHSYWARLVTFSSDGRMLASGSYDNTLKLWDVLSGECLKTFDQHTDWVRSVTFNPDGGQLASGSSDNTLKLWDVLSGECLQTFDQHQGGVNSVTFSPDGGQLASGSDDKTVKLWDVLSGECLKTFDQHTDWVRSVTFSPDGGQLASGSDDKTVKLWDVLSGECLNTFDQHQGYVNSVTFSPDGRQLASGSEDKTVKLWDVLSGECLKTCYHLPDNNAVTIDEATGRIVYGSAEAWRWLRYREVLDSGETILHPAEIFGPLPGSE